ncbi:unnamed protein product [Eruca vesicaria subsp. sativa]|uniref:Uncharacterized protein n=1 Tax=Eruca vesicaria subsp. sativa TaxID=29727 RepID=A0ABC8LEA7_ERUVS|nr:unnamed protein product [Eruca vesicaria subsp. sativa]
MGIVASLYGCLEYSKEPTLETSEDTVANMIGGHDFRRRLDSYGCFMETIFQTSAGAVVLTDAIPMVSDGIFRAMELSLHCLPMDHPRIWIINLESRDHLLCRS